MVSGVLPLSRSTAASAAAPPTISLGLEMVLYWSPAMISCRPATVASLPLTGGTAPPADLKAAIVPPPVPSLAATTPAILSSPKREIWPATHFCAFSGFQSIVSYSASTGTPLLSTASWMPFLISPAAASVGEPFTSSRPPPLGTEPSLTLSTSDLPMALPMPSLSKET